jgi:hypothetical protein
MDDQPEITKEQLYRAAVGEPKDDFHIPRFLAHRQGLSLRPWKSRYLRWRFETFLGAEAADMNAGKFFRLSGKYRARIKKFVEWSQERRKAKRKKPPI